jgi:hypothetical protein
LLAGRKIRGGIRQREDTIASLMLECAQKKFSGVGERFQRLLLVTSDHDLTVEV